MNAQSEWYKTAKARHGQSTSQASTLVRSLALAAVATVWAFAGGFGSGVDPNKAVIDVVLADGTLKPAMISALLAVTLDIFQYLWLSLWQSVHLWYCSAVFDPLPDPVSLPWRRQWAMRLAQLNGVFDDIEKATGVNASAAPGAVSYLQRRTDLRTLMVSLGSMEKWPENTPQFKALAYLSADAERPIHLANVAFIAKAAALGVAYLELLRFVL
jgi:hypothetical protein